MGKRDYRHHEPKKKKKEARKSLGVSIVAPPSHVEVVRKKRKERPEPEQAE